MFVPLLLVICFSCQVEGRACPPSKNVIKTAPTFFATSSSSNTASGCFAESTVDIDNEIRKTRNIINSNYKFRPHQCGGPGWTRAYYLNMDNPKSQCPVNWTLYNNTRGCVRKNFDGSRSCDSLIIPVSNMKYSTICGRIYAYQYGWSSGFHNFNSRTIDGYYVDGLSLTHGSPGNRHHIWSFAAADDETSSNTFDHVSCPCINTSNMMISKPPSFVGDDYFCDTGAHDYDGFRIYKENPLWDGEGCGGVSTCCSFNNPPWFYKKLNYSTKNDLELRLCGTAIYTYEDRVLIRVRFDDNIVYLVEIYIK